MQRVKEALLLVLLVAACAAPRLIGLGAFTSIDEPFWLRVSGNFYYAITHRDFAHTIFEYHPAVTTMWVIAAGMLAYFPQYRSLAPGYLRPNKFDAFMLEQGRSLLQLLVVSRLIQVMLVVALMLVAYWLLRRLYGMRTAMFTTAFISVSPFFVGQSRLLNHEAMLASFLLISLLAMLVYLYAERRVWFLVVSGAAAALAQLTKSSGALLFPVIGLILLVAALRSTERKRGPALLDAARTLLLWLLFLAAAYTLFWPGMWVAPGRMLSDVYGNALTYVFHGARVESSGNVGGILRLRGIVRGVLVYLNDLGWRVTPLSWLGFLAGLIFSFVKRADERKRGIGLAVLYACILGLLFVVLFGTQRGPKPPHYILTSYIMIDLVAGLGFARLLEWVLRRHPRLERPFAPAAALGLLAALQLLASAAFHPYYITYYDPLVEAVQPGQQNPTLRDTGYGVGLDRAAAYLADKPGAAGMTIMSVNGLGSFSYYFPGTTIAMNYLSLSDPLVAGGLTDSQYVVVDYYNQARSKQLADLQGIEPEKTIWINGIDFLRIYRSADILARTQADQP